MHSQMIGRHHLQIELTPYETGQLYQILQLIAQNTNPNTPDLLESLRDIGTATGLPTWQEFYAILRANLDIQT